MSSSRRWARETASLSENFAQLGFEPARTQTYDWMASFPDAHAFLEAMQTCFTKSDVLSEKEAKKHEEIAQSGTLLNSADALLAADPLLSSESELSLSEAREKRLLSARERLDCLKAQKEALIELLASSGEEEERVQTPVESNEREYVQQTCSRLYELADDLQDFAGEQLDGSKVSSDFETFLGTEKNFSTEIADMATPGFQANSMTFSSSKLDWDSVAKKAINSYAKLQAKTYVCEAIVARDLAMMASLSTDDGKYMEMTTSSMIPLIKELQSSGVKALNKRTKTLEEEARQGLMNQLAVISLSDKQKRQTAYIETMQLSLSSFVQQRIRLICLQSVVESMLSVRDQLETCFAKLSCTSDRPGVIVYPEPPPNVDSNPEHQQNISSELCDEPNTGCDGEEGVNDCTSGQILKKRVELDRAETELFFSVALGTLNQVKGFTSRHSSSRESFNLDTNPRFAAVISDLKDFILKNSVVLDALMKKRTLIVVGSSNPQRSPSRMWTQRVLSSSRKIPSSDRKDLRIPGS